MSKTMKWQGLRAAALATAIGAAAAGTAGATELPVEPPSTTVKAGVKPSELLKLRPALEAPDLVGGLLDVKTTVGKFVDWAAGSSAGEEDKVRNGIAAASKQDAVAVALCELVNASMKVNHARALVGLALLGEMKNSAAVDCLKRIVDLPLPTTGMKIEGEIQEAVALAQLQMKAIDGLAFSPDSAAQDKVMQVAASHPSKAVRAEAIGAFLWNAQGSADARAKLEVKLKNEDKIFLDRIEKGPGQKPEEFNAKLDEFMKKHPEVKPPGLEKATAAAKPPTLTAPPAF
jgi:hypothetical protein